MQIFKSPLSPGYWKESAQTFQSVRCLVTSALLVALSIVISSFYIPVGETHRIYFSFLVLGVCALVCGPEMALTCGFVEDIVGFMIHPAGPFFFGYTISTMLAMLVYALFFFRVRISILRIFLAKLTVNLVVNVLFGSLWSAMLFSKGYLYYLVMGLIKNGAMLVPEVILLIILLQALLPILQRQGIIPNQMGKRIPWM